MYNAVRRFGKVRYDTLRLPHGWWRARPTARSSSARARAPPTSSTPTSTPTGGYRCRGSTPCFPPRRRFRRQRWPPPPTSRRSRRGEGNYWRWRAGCLEASASKLNSPLASRKRKRKKKKKREENTKRKLMPQIICSLLNNTKGANRCLFCLYTKNLLETEQWIDRWMYSLYSNVFVLLFMILIHWKICNK
ncbi:putative fasciclin-like arabinogalactan protein 15 [Iris pallida]|uniref:Fasciclin-like arabinogalactan protein 15 n=1 Tax=Iris pallida TaxID=29817 RepID=A0AAX6DKN5_IRIPA|nr:putative fasciclin-like arabinogalactan protein 15 [Iris pallida]